MLIAAFRAFQLFIAFSYFPLEFKLVSAFFALILVSRHYFTTFLIKIILRLPEGFSHNYYLCYNLKLEDGLCM